MKVKFKWIGGATWILQIDDIKIACDPVLCPKGTIHDYKFFKSKRLSEPIYNEDDFDGIDIWLITHGHEDHIDKFGIKYIKEDSYIITDKSAVKILQESGIKKYNLLRWGDIKILNINQYDIKIKAVPAVHGVNPLVARLAGNVNGYLLEIKYGNTKKTVYITSDTVNHKKAVNAVKKEKIDLMIPNMGAVYKRTKFGVMTLTAGMLKELIVLLNPEIGPTSRHG